MLLCSIDYGGSLNENPVEPKPITDPAPPKKGAETFADAAAIYLKNELRDDVKPATVNARA